MHDLYEEVLNNTPATHHRDRLRRLASLTVSNLFICKDALIFKPQTSSQVLERIERLVHLQSELSCLQQIHKDSTKEIAEKDVCITKLRATIELLQQEGSDTYSQVGRDKYRSSVKVKASVQQCIAYLCPAPRVSSAETHKI